MWLLARQIHDAMPGGDKFALVINWSGSVGFWLASQLLEGTPWWVAAIFVGVATFSSAFYVVAKGVEVLRRSARELREIEQRDEN